MQCSPLSNDAYFCVYNLHFATKHCSQEFDGASSDYGPLVEAGRRAILAAFAACGMPDVERHIVNEFVIDPTEWKSR